MTGVMKPNSDYSAAQMMNLRSECTFVRIDHPPRDNRASDLTGIIPLNMKTPNQLEAVTATQGLQPCYSSFF